MPQTAVKKKVSMIPAKPQYDRSIKLSEKKLRVAAYCRVSTELEEQESSYEAQVEYYTRKIQETDKRKMAEIYADDGKSATNTKKRDDFNAMIKDAFGWKNRHDTDKVGKPIRQKYGRFPADHSKTEGKECSGGFRERGCQHLGWNRRNPDYHLKQFGTGREP